MSPVIPPCQTIGLIDLCAPATTIVAGAKVDVGQPWFLIQVPNLIWFATLSALIVLAMLVPLPTREIDAASGKGEGD